MALIPQMSPALMSLDPRNLLFRYVESFRDADLCSYGVMDFSDNLFCQGRLRILFSARRVPMLDHCRRVLKRAAPAEIFESIIMLIWVPAVVAMMSLALVFWWWTDMREKNESMDEGGPLDSISGIVSAVKIHLEVSLVMIERLKYASLHPAHVMPRPPVRLMPNHPVDGSNAAECAGFVPVKSRNNLPNLHGVHLRHFPMASI